MRLDGSVGLWKAFKRVYMGLDELCPSMEGFLERMYEVRWLCWSLEGFLERIYEVRLSVGLLEAFKRGFMRLDGVCWSLARCSETLGTLELDKALFC